MIYHLMKIRYKIFISIDFICCIITAPSKELKKRGDDFTIKLMEVGADRQV